MCRIARLDLARHHPVEEVTDCSKAQFHGGDSMAPAKVFNPGRHMHRLNRGEEVTPALRTIP